MKKGRKLGPLGLVGLHLLKKGLQAANSRPPDDPRPVLIQLIRIDPGILHGLRSCRKGKLRKQIMFPGFLPVYAIPCRIKIPHLAGKFRFVKLRIKLGDRATPANAVLQIFPEKINRIA